LLHPPRHMLTSNGVAAPISVTRKHDIGPQFKTAMGAEPGVLRRSPTPFPAPHCTGQLPLEHAVREEFNAWTESDSIEPKRFKSVKACAEKGEALFSTNDVLVSSFACSMGVWVLQLLMPLRSHNWLPDFTQHDAEMYECCLVLGTKDCADATSMRITLQSGPLAFVRCADLPDSEMRN
jgi:hypothetical protein